MRSPCVVMVFVACWLAGGAAHADVLHLNNGNQVRGVVVAQDTRGVRLEVGRHMRVTYGTAEIARLERESEAANAALRRSWDSTPGGEPPGSTTQRERSGPDAAAPRLSEEQARRNEVILNLDMEEVMARPEEVAALLGRPQVERTGESRAGQKLLEWGYDVGDGLLRIIRFREMAGGYMATNSYEERASENGSERDTGTAPKAREEEQ